VAAGVLGAVAGLVTFGVVADVGNRFAVAAVLTFLPAACFAALFCWCPRRAGKEPEDLWPAEAVPVVMPDEASMGVPQVGRQGCERRPYGP